MNGALASGGLSVDAVDDSGCTLSADQTIDELLHLKCHAISPVSGTALILLPVSKLEVSLMSLLSAERLQAQAQTRLAFAETTTQHIAHNWCL